MIFPYNTKSNICIVIVLLFLVLPVCHNAVATCPTGDLNGDCLVTIDDLVIMAEHWLGAPGSPGDITGNNGVNLADFSLLLAHWQQQGDRFITINEIHYNPDKNTDLVEFVELCNTGPYAKDISGWFFDSGIKYTFPANSTIPAGGYIVVTQNPTALISKYSVPVELVYGPFSGKLSNDGENISLCNISGDEIDHVKYKSAFPWPVVGYEIPDGHPGTGSSIQLTNPAFDNDLAGSWRSAYPTPAARNEAVFATNIPPQIRQVKHFPVQPHAGENIIVSAKITDPDGVGTIRLYYQIVAPGHYIPAYLPLDHSTLLSSPYQALPANPDFKDPANWTQIVMLDDGNGSDELAGDNIYTATIPGQNNRTLVRYRINVSDIYGNNIGVPYADDPSLNFACYVYNGVPPYTASKESVDPEGAGHIYSQKIMTSLPVFSLITRAEDMTECIAYNSAYQIPASNDGARRKFNWEGAFVYEGKVYDHVLYRLRQVNQRYAGHGKRSFRIRFQRGNYLQARDIYGNKFPTKWRSLNINKGCDNLLNNGNFGLNEIMNSQLFNMAEVPAPWMFYFHFRVVDGQYEVPPGENGQYYGDFWGLFLGVEDYDSRFLKAHHLPDGNLYKLKGGVYNGNRLKRHQGTYSVQTDADFQNIRYNLDPDKSDAWLNKYVDYQHWYRYNSICEMVKHRDYNPSDGWLKNRAWFFNPTNTSPYGQLQTLPHDSDGSWADNVWNGDGDYPEEAIYADHPGPPHDDPSNKYYYYYQGTWPPKENFKLEHRNVMRELRDLIWQKDNIYTMLDDLAGIIKDFVPADRDRWKDAPADAGYQDWGTMESKLASMKQFAFGNGGRTEYIDNFINSGNDATSIPDTPVVSYTGPEGFPVNNLTFSTTPFSDPQGNDTFAAMKWRIAEITPLPKPPTTVTILEKQQIWKYIKGLSEPPATWMQPGFDDSTWLAGQTSIGYGDNDDNTVLGDMRNNYTTIYMRKEFTITQENLNNAQSLLINLYVDDGCIIWINGTEAARFNANGTKYYNSFSNGTVGSLPTWQTISLDNPLDYLHSGTNTIAMHVLNATKGSSDLSADISLQIMTGSEPHSGLVKRKYEYTDPWISPEMSTFQANIHIPASVVTPGKIYRLRCKMKDNTNRWSHWSAPVEFTAGKALPNDLLKHLRISEIMYNPAPADTSKGELNVDNDEFEFIELKNTGNTRVDLTGVSFTDGVYFTFSPKAIHLKLDELSGAIAPDELGNYNGLLKGNPSWQPVGGKYNGAIELNGSSDYIEIPGYKGITANKPRTVMTWLKTSATGNVTFAHWGDTGTGRAWFNQLDDGVLRVAVWGGWVKGSTPLNDGQWHHVAIVLPNKTDVNITDVKLYIDGTVDSVADSLPCAVNTAAQNDVMLGGYHIGANYVANFAGLIDDVRIYNKALTPAEISDAMNNAPVTTNQLTPNTLDANCFILVVRNIEAFTSRYGNALSAFIAGTYDGKLSNSGENITVKDYLNGTIMDFTYDDKFPWPESADGAGYSLIPLNSAMQDPNSMLLNNAANWTHSQNINGSPCSDDPAANP